MMPKTHSSSRYEVIAKIASGGMATVYLGTHRGPFGFEQLVAIKKLHAHLLDDVAVRESLLMEARSASRIRHVNVVDVRDIEVSDDGVQLIMTYVEGASLATLVTHATRKKMKVPTSIVIRIILDICAGLHAAHELNDDLGKPLGLVHRDVSPQNVLIGIDGIARITDFGVARDESSHRLHTRTGALKGKFAYMAPEYIHGERPDRRADIFALAAMLWEALSGKRLFKGNNDADTITRVTSLDPPSLANIVPELGEGIDSVLEMALSKNPETRFSTAQALGLALETVASKANMIATAAEVGQYVRENARAELERLEQMRHASARSSGTNEGPVSLQVESKEPPPIVTEELISMSNISPSPLVDGGILEDTHVAPPSYHQRASDMMGDSTDSSLTGEEPTTPRKWGVPTLRTPASEEVHDAPSSVAVVSAPAVLTETDCAPQPSMRVGPMGTALMGPLPQMRDLVFRTLAAGDSAVAPANSVQVLTPTTNSMTTPHSVRTLPVPISRDEIAVLPFVREKPISHRASRMRWLLAACLLFVLSGVCVTLIVVPGLHDGRASSEAKK